MPVKILVPFKAVSEVAGSTLVINYPNRCSICGSETADYFETHHLQLRAGRKRPGLYRAKYQINKKYQLKIKVCETCYQAGYLADPDTFDRDPTPLGRLARIISAGYMIGAIIAAVGLLLLSGLLPDVGLSSDYEIYWKFLAGIGLLIIVGMWLLQRRQQNKIRSELLARGIKLEKPFRADIFTPVVETVDDPQATALTIGLSDEQWAQECAKHYGWISQSYETGEKRGIE